MTVSDQRCRRTWTEIVMGLPVSVLVRGPAAADPSTERAVVALYAELHFADTVFSTYQPGSEISRIRSGQLDVGDASAVVAEAIGLCEQARRDTEGAFDASLPCADGQRRLDPSGLVKGWAVERASAALESLDGVDWIVNAGGDVLSRSPSVEPWRIAIEDPRDRSKFLLALSLTDGAVATSGTSARGAHLIDPRTGEPPTHDLLSATVAGPSLTTADVRATALFIDGVPGLATIAELAQYEAVVVLSDGRMLGTPGIHGLFT